MTRFFLWLYRFFRAHRVVFLSLLILSFAFFIWFGLKIRLEENITALLPKTEKSRECEVAFGDIRIKDKVFVQLRSRDGSASPAELAAAMDSFMETMLRRDSAGLTCNCLWKLDSDDMMNLVYYGLEALPCHLGASFYEAMDSLVFGDRIAPDDIGRFLSVEPALASFTIAGGQLFSADTTLALAFVSPSFHSLETAKSCELEALVSASADEFSAAYPGFEVLYHGFVIEGAFNSGQIKKDIFWTTGISLLLICLLIGISFKGRWTLAQMLLPVLYGTFFSLACMYFLKGSLSLIALGIGAIVLGVAISYCLHVITHYKFMHDVETVIREQAKPVCLGCITTVGAFMGLLLTSSELLHDFGIFASLALAGTTFFSLAFLPQFFGGNPDKNEKVFSVVNRINSYPLDRNVPVVVIVVLVCLVCIFTSRKVRFDSDLNNIGYKEPKVVRSMQLYNEKINGSHFQAYYASLSTDLDSAILGSRKLARLLDSLKKAGDIYSFSSSEGLLVPRSEQEANIRRWKEYWTPDRVSYVYGLLKKESAAGGWNLGGFDIPETFRLMAESDFEPQSLYDAGVIPEALMCNFVERTDSGWLVFTEVKMDEERKMEIFEKIDKGGNTIAMDPFYYTGDMVEIVRDDFNKVLLVSSIFVFLVLLLSFRSLIVAGIAFLPMMLSWYVVQGIMAIFGIEFNLINIMISTFVFGIGVDYSIFVIAGLINKNRYRSYRLLTCHKAAIFFSGIILMIVTSSLLFATHPAIHSIGVSTIIGMSSTILITYSLQPLLFRAAMKVPLLRKEALHAR